MQNLQEDLTTLLQNEDNLVVDGHLNKNKIIELALKVEPQLIRLLLSNDAFAKHFFQKVDEVLIFDKIKFQRFVNNKSFLPDSYTAFKNKIGLVIDDEYSDNYITASKEVALAFPHKDCVLEGGQTKEDQKRNEVFWNETLAPDSVDRLLSPKVLTNFTRYSKEGEEKVNDFSSKDNLLLKGNNLLCLASLLKTHRGKVKLIYIDPPYNTGNDFGYNDKFNHSAWLTFIKNRLEIAKQLLTNDGSIWMNIDDGEAHYLKVLADEIFGRENFLHNVIWEKKYTVANDSKYFSDNHDHIIAFSKNKESFRVNKLPRTEKMNKAYTNPDGHPKGVWKSTPLQARSGNDPCFTHTFPNGVEWRPPIGRFSAYSHDSLNDLYDNNEIYFGKDGNAIASRKTFLSELKSSGLIPRTLWRFDEVGHNHESMTEIKSLFGNNAFLTPKPERLLQRILHIASNEGDLVLDFFSGSGTTGAVAHKMNRKWIITEQMDYIETVTKERLKKVIEGEEGGISKEVNWSGGGSFVYAELYPYNQTFLNAIQKAKSKEALVTIWEEMKVKAFLSYSFDAEVFDTRLEAFKTASLDYMKTYLIEILDKNQLYVNLSEIDDETFAISDEVKELNKSFYNTKF